MNMKREKQVSTGIQSDRNKYAPYATRCMEVLPQDWIEFSVCKFRDMKFSPSMNAWVSLSPFIVESSACPNMIRELILDVWVGSLQECSVSLYSNIFFWLIDTGFPYRSISGLLTKWTQCHLIPRN